MIIQIYEGTSVNSVLRSDYECVPSSFVYKRDLTQSSSSDLTVVVKDKPTIKKFDTFYLKFNDLNLVGRIIEVEITENQQAKLKLQIGADAGINTIIIEDNSQDSWQQTINNNQNLLVNFSSTTTVISTDHTLTFDNIIRQAMRKQHHSETMSKRYIDSGLFIGNNVLYCTVQQIDEIEYELNLNDYDIYDRNVYIDSDTFNLVMLIDQDHLTFSYFDFNDGTEPTIEKAELVESKNLSYDYAYALYKQQEYANEITFNVNLKNEKSALEFNETFLGRKLKIYYNKLDEPISTIISAFEVGVDLNCKITLGLSRTKLTSKLNKDKI